MLRTFETTQKLFDDWAKTYDENVKEADGPLYGYNHSLCEATEMIHINEQQKIIDIGIGTGAFASLISVNDNHVFGIDLSEKMLEQCNAKYPQYQVNYPPLKR